MNDYQEDVEAAEYLRGFQARCDHDQSVILGREREPYNMKRGLGYVCCLEGCGHQAFMPQTWQITFTIELETLLPV